MKLEQLKSLPLGTQVVISQSISTYKAIIISEPYKAGPTWKVRIKPTSVSLSEREVSIGNVQLPGYVR